METVKFRVRHQLPGGSEYIENPRDGSNEFSVFNDIHYFDNIGKTLAEALLKGRIPLAAGDSLHIEEIE